MLEEKLAYLERLAEDLSDIVADQGRRILHLEAQLSILREAEAARMADGGSVLIGSERPPHW